MHWPALHREDTPCLSLKLRHDLQFPSTHKKYKEITYYSGYYVQNKTNNPLGLKDPCPHILMGRPYLKFKERSAINNPSS